MDKKLISKAKDKLHKELDGTKVYDTRFRCWRAQYAEFTFGNTRTVKVKRSIPVYKLGAKGEIHYSIEMLGEYTKDHLTIDEVAETLLEWGFKNTTIVTADMGAKTLEDMGFRAINKMSDTNLSDIAFNLSEGVWKYKLEVEQNYTYYGSDYDTGTSPYYYGSTYRDVFKREYLMVDMGNGDYVQLAYRDVKVGSQCVSNYVGD